MEPPMPASTGQSEGRFAEHFFPTLLANVLSIAGMGLVTFFLVDRDAAEQSARAGVLRDQIDALRAEQDRVGRLNQELAREVHDVGAEADVLRWQLRYTEERLRAAEERPAAARPAAVRARVEVEPLDAAAAKWLDARVGEIAAGSDRDDREAEGAPLALADFDPGIPSLRKVGSQFDRDAAKVLWDGVVDEAVGGECGKAGTDGRAWKCADGVRRRLFPFATAAVNCVISGNAQPDYVESVELDNLPSHSVPLARGGVILCDGALENF